MIRLPRCVTQWLDTVPMLVGIGSLFGMIAAVTLPSRVLDVLYGPEDSVDGYTPIPAPEVPHAA